MSSCGCVLFAIKKIFLPRTHTKTSCETVLTVIDLCPLGPIKEDLEALTEGNVTLNPIPPAPILFSPFVQVCIKTIPLGKKADKKTIAVNQITFTSLKSWESHNLYTFVTYKK